MTKALLLSAVAMLVMSHAAPAQNHASVSGAKATARIIRPISISKCSNLSFGNVIGSHSGGTVVVPSSSSTTATYNSVSNLKPGAQTGVITAARFCVSGETGFAFTMAPVSGSPITITGPSCGSCTNTMIVNLGAPSIPQSSIIPSGGTGCSGTGSGEDEDEDDDDHHHDDDNENCNSTAAGTICYFVGGTLNVPAVGNLQTGVYTGTWFETVSY